MTISRMEVQLDAELHERFERTTRHAGSTMSAEVRKFVERYVKGKKMAQRRKR